MRGKDSSLKQRILSVIDANYNRAKEGLRVVEDTLRFVKQDKKIMYELKSVRHDLTRSIKKGLVRAAIATRDSARDFGRDTDRWEMRRDSVDEILWANLQRVKEALRVLEEFLKLIDSASVRSIKKIRYDTYELEKHIIAKEYHLRHSR